MKKITILFLFVISFANAQTTDEEYNYITKGYKETISKGLDLKKGYFFKDMYHYNDGAYDFQFQYFVNDSTKKLACIMVVANSLVWGNKYYLCIPVDNEKLKNQYKSALNAWDAQILSAYSLAFSDFASKALAGAKF